MTHALTDTHHLMTAEFMLIRLRTNQSMSRSMITDEQQQNELGGTCLETMINRLVSLYARWTLSMDAA